MDQFKAIDLSIFLGKVDHPKVLSIECLVISNISLATTTGDDSIADDDTKFNALQTSENWCPRCRFI